MVYKVKLIIILSVISINDCEKSFYILTRQCFTLTGSQQQEHLSKHTW